MTTIETFEAQHLKLYPEADDFVVQVDDLIMTIDTDKHERLIPSIFEFFELNSLLRPNFQGASMYEYGLEKRI
ncbi:MAG: hypothetical protein NXI20_00760 [bacterium]|nr:hypothetical protein [bacterium]